MVVAQLVRASDCGSEGRRFNSDQSPHKLRGEWFPTGLISRVSQVQLLTPQQKRFEIIWNIRIYFLPL